MDNTIVSDNPYLCPLSTSQTVREAMLRDWCTWDSDYHSLVQQIREKLASMASSSLFDFTKFYKLLKLRGFVIYPGKITKTNTFRIANIGEVYEEDVHRLLEAIKESIYW